MREGSDDRHLFIVSRAAPQVAEFLREQFPPGSNVTVLVDRRHGERRRDSTPAAQERRGADRRQRSDVAAELVRHTHAFVTVKPA